MGVCDSIKAAQLQARSKDLAFRRMEEDIILRGWDEPYIETNVDKIFADVDVNGRYNMPPTHADLNEMERQYLPPDYFDYHHIEADTLPAWKTISDRITNKLK
ncbi:MAG: hypothetical protein MJH10_14535 [Epibacterium sp.]|nr:hypothetical protein [Epibacterium sp.]NQX74744.1 hypothetical protein [Epibacterium sp.]